jgi:adenylate cyclase
MLWRSCRFANPDPATQHLSDGLTEILIDTISRVSGLRVMARTTVFEQKGKDPLAAGRDLDVRAVVTGNVQPEAGNFRIHVEVIDVADGTQLWGRQYRTAAASLADTQRQITADLSNILRGGIARNGRGGASARYTQNAKAYDLYLRGLYRWNQRGEQNLRASIELFNQAVAEDPAFAAAHAGLANAYGVMTGIGFIPPETGSALVKAAARKALALDPDNAEAYVSLATSEFRNLWDFAAAEQNYRTGLALNPNYATGHQWYSDFLRAMGRLAEARREIDVAYELDPLSLPIAGTKCWSLYTERRYEEAVAFATKSRRAGPHLSFPFCEGRALIALGRFDEAFDLSPPNEPTSAEQVRRSREAYRAKGLRGLYETRLEFQLQRQGSSVQIPVEIAQTCSMLGRTDEAFAWLEKAYEQRISRLTNIGLDPELDPIRDDPRFDDLLRRIGIPKIPLPGPAMKPAP